MPTDPIYPEEADLLREWVRRDRMATGERRALALRPLTIPLSIAERLAQLGYVTASGRTHFLTDKARKEFADAD